MKRHRQSGVEPPHSKTRRAISEDGPQQKARSQAKSRSFASLWMTKKTTGRLPGWLGFLASGGGGSWIAGLFFAGGGVLGGFLRNLCRRGNLWGVWGSGLGGG